MTQWKRVSTSDKLEFQIYLGRCWYLGTLGQRYIGIFRLLSKTNTNVKVCACIKPNQCPWYRFFIPLCQIIAEMCIDILEHALPSKWHLFPGTPLYLFINLFGLKFKHNVKDNFVHYKDMAAKLIGEMYKTCLQSWPISPQQKICWAEFWAWVFADNSAFIYFLRNDCSWLPKTMMDGQDFNLLLITLSKALGRTKCQAQNDCLWSYFISWDIRVILNKTMQNPILHIAKASCKRSGCFGLTSVQTFHS